MNGSNVDQIRWSGSILNLGSSSRLYFRFGLNMHYIRWLVHMLLSIKSLYFSPKTCCCSSSTHRTLRWIRPPSRPHWHPHRPPPHPPSQHSPSSSPARAVAHLCHHRPTRGRRRKVDVNTIEAGDVQDRRRDVGDKLELRGSKPERWRLVNCSHSTWYILVHCTFSFFWLDLMTTSIFFSIP